MSDCFKKNELLIPGTRQSERLPNALDPLFVLPEERKIDDWMVFIARYAKILNYYAVKDGQVDYKIDGDWEPLIKSDEAFTYAGISVIRSGLPNITFFQFVDQYESGSTPLLRFEAYRVWWDILFSVYRDINQFYQNIPVHMPLRNLVAREVLNQLATDMGIAAGAYLNSKKVNGSGNTALPTFNPFVATANGDSEYKFGFGQTILQTGFDPIWIDKNLSLATTWSGYLSFLNSAISLSDQFFHTNTITAEFDRIDYSTISLKQLFRRAFESYTRIITLAGDMLQASLDESSNHQAHHGLMLAFLKLFGLVHGDMNQFTKNHLEYYYQRVLQLQPAAATPDAVHAVFLPAKTVESHLIPKGTSLLAGKDAMGKVLLYNTDQELVITQATLEGIKTLYLEPNSSMPKVEQVYASPIAKSEDGLGAPFTTDDTSWKAFGDIRKDVTGTEVVNKAMLGFFIASPVLHLTEGSRVIEIVWNGDSGSNTILNGLTTLDWSTAFYIYTTGEKGWEELTTANSSIVYSGIDRKLTLTLQEQFPMVSSYQEPVHLNAIDTVFPVFKFVLKQQTTGEYEKFKHIKLVSIAITVTASEITDLSLQNDAGILDAAKPIPLFGSLPKKGSVFYIGHPELEHKNINWIELTLSWQQYVADLKTTVYNYKKNTATSPYISGLNSNADFKVRVDFLRNKAWQAFTTSPHDSFINSENKTLSYSGLSVAQAQVRPESYQKPKLVYEPDVRNGFVRFQLDSPADGFGHAKWPKLFAEQTVLFEKVPADNSIPEPPYTPTLASLKLKYRATQTLGFGGSYDGRAGEFIHLLPFGHQGIKENPTLVPVFTMEVLDDNSQISEEYIESAIYIGVQGVMPRQTLSMLLQVNEGSEDISVDHSEVSWNYLSDTGWKHLNKGLVGDDTSGLIRSGVVSVEIPVDLPEKITQLPTATLWLRAGLRFGSMGLPRIIDIHLHAVKAYFNDQGNDPGHLENPLAAGKISRLYEADGQVKKVLQPYASFGGKMVESGSYYYQRISERLRHKNRAITIWDYEHLVLNQFQEVYMVKCLNHTGFTHGCNNQQPAYRENYAGHVLVVPVPYVSDLNTGNIFRPTFSSSKLTDILRYLTGWISSGPCQASWPALHPQLSHLEVRNPLYETIKIECKIKVRDCFDANFYKAQLVEDLNYFLSPWISGEESQIRFGGSLHDSVVIYFIEQLPYIDYLEDLKMFHEGTEVREAVTTTSHSILTSFGTHDIQLLLS